MNAPAPGWDARLDLGFRRTAERTWLARRSHTGPLRLQRPLYPEGASVCHAILLHPAGGLVGGDALAISVELEAGAQALITTPGATKWYRSAGAQASQVQDLRVAAGGLLEWLPQEAILFQGTRARQHTRVDLEAGGRFAGWEILQFGRPASGEGFAQGSLDLRTEIFLAGRPIWHEAALLDGGGRWLTSRAGLAGASVTATFWVAGAPAGDAVVDRLRELVAGGPGQVAVTRLPGLVVLRYLGNSAQEAKARLWTAWAWLRSEIAGRVGGMPRIWAT